MRITMKCGIFLGSLSLLLVAPHEAAPVLKKVVSMLQGMKESSEKEKHEEEVWLCPHHRINVRIPTTHRSHTRIIQKVSGGPQAV